jgi:drug/metabolite transporter (DMT)-like permease
MLGEKITSGLIAGGALILVGLYLTERERDRRPNHEK